MTINDAADAKRVVFFFDLAFIQRDATQAAER